MLQAFLQGARELFFPDNCLLCRQFLNSHHQRQLCPSCLGLLEFNNGKNMCEPAQHHYAFDQAWSVCLYNDTAKKLLHAFKYNSKTSLAKTFVPLMIDFVERNQIPVRQFDMILPIPLHPARLRDRGYNQSSLLSRGLSSHWGILHAENLLVRGKPTNTQTELDAKQRWTNLQGAFRMNNSAHISGQSVLIIDDLFTTGATLNAAADALKNAGAARVGVLTLGIAV